MARIHAFGDDALGDHDAVGLVDALRAGDVSAAELVEAAIARTEAVNPTLNGLAYEAFDRARGRANAARPYGGYFDGVPTFFKDNVAVAGMPTMEGTDAWQPRPMRADGAFARVFCPPALCRLARPRCRSSASAHRLNIRGSGRFGIHGTPSAPPARPRRVRCIRRSWRGAHRTRQ